MNEIRVPTKQEAAVLDVYTQVGTWKNVGEHYGLSPTLVNRFATTDYEPVDFFARNALGLVPTIRQKSIKCVCCGNRNGYNVYRLPCPYCNEYFIIAESDLDHIIPKGSNHRGPDNQWNMIRCCSPCNRAKNQKTPWEWLGPNWEPTNPDYAEKFNKAKSRLFMYPKLTGELEEAA